MADMDVSVLTERLKSLHSDVSEIKGAMRDLTSAITKLALVEERQANYSAAQERAFATIARIETRLGDLEKNAPITERTNGWVERGVLAVVGAALMFAWEKLKG